MRLNNRHKWGKAILWSLSLIGSGVIAVAATSTFTTHEFFYVGGKYTGAPGKQVMAGQMFVEVLRPQRITQKYPMVFFHGSSETATNWMSTVDGRIGWADYFAGQGYVVYLVDQPARGRSPWQASANGPSKMLFSVFDAVLFLDIEEYGYWPQAKKHTQWPGTLPEKYRQGNPIFDAFYASLVPQLTSTIETQTLIQAAGSALLDKIGPAILLTHSQSGRFGWLLADSRPKAVKGIVAVEPGGPPLRNDMVDEDMVKVEPVIKVAREGTISPGLPWGITDIPLTYSPPAQAATDLKPVREAQRDGPNLAYCWKQADPPRQLPNLQGTPIAIVSSEASFHAVYDHCTSKYLAQAGVKNTHIRLEDHGLHGNGHNMMLEKNNLEVAALLHKWISANIK
jgi:pimeloyl-ACP methyl ester carboxylesterase